MSKLRPISAPLGRRWREFRIEYLPALAFAASVLAVVSLWPHSTPRVYQNGNTAPVSEETKFESEPAPTAVATYSPVTFSRANITNPPPAFSD